MYGMRLKQNNYNNNPQKPGIGYSDIVNSKLIKLKEEIKNKNKYELLNKTIQRASAVTRCSIALCSSAFISCFGHLLTIVTTVTRASHSSGSMTPSFNVLLGQDISGKLGGVSLLELQG